MVIWLNSPCIDYEAMHFPISLVLQSIPLNLSWVHDFRNVSSQFQGVDSGQNRKRVRGSSRKKGEEHIVLVQLLSPFCSSQVGQHNEKKEKIFLVSND